jgi:hypothetical protein
VEREEIMRSFTPVILIFIVAVQPCFADNSTPVIRPPKVDAPPRIDGLLDELLWSAIEPITDFVQQDPDAGAPSTERTGVRICYDSRFLYFGIRAYDSRPEGLIANIFERDGDIWSNDSLAIIIDSLNDRRTAITFSTNSRGAQTDGQLFPGGQWEGSFDPIWYSEGHVDSQGYTLEVAIPFFVLRFKPAEEVSMGLLMRRNLQHKNERAYWPALSRDHNFWNMELYGHIEGLRGIERGVNLEIKPYGIAGRSQAPTEKDTKIDAGLDVKWGVTTNLTADFTLNTDFAQVEHDDFLVSINRFDLYYPEKRDFFVESEDLFHFGIRESAHLFFSRRIGLSASGEVPILGGARLYGLVGSTNVGLMSMQTREKYGVPGENFTVARIKQNILTNSYVGGIVTSRSGNRSEEDRTWGLDFTLYHSPNAGFSGALARSGRQGIDEGDWFRYLSYFNLSDRFDARVEYTDIGPKFDPGIGFIQHPDQRTIFLYGAYKPRPEWRGVRQLLFSGDYTRTYNCDGEVENSKIMHWTEFFLDSRDQINIAAYYQEEFIPADFEYAPGVVIHRGPYEMGHMGLGIETSTARKVDGQFIIARGGFYGGDVSIGKIKINYKPMPKVQFGAGIEHYAFNLPQKSFQHSLYSTHLSYYFSPRLTTRLIAQYDSLYKEFFLNLRLRWLYAPGSEAWLVYDEGRRYDLPGPSLQDRALIFKVVYNFNF